MVIKYGEKAGKIWFNCNECVTIEVYQLSERVYCGFFQRK